MSPVRKYEKIEKLYNWQEFILHILSFSNPLTDLSGSVVNYATKLVKEINER